MGRLQLLQVDTVYVQYHVRMYVRMCVFITNTVNTYANTYVDTNAEHGCSKPVNCAKYNN